jgi:uncharacterized protein
VTHSLPLFKVPVAIDPVRMVVLQSTTGCNLNCDYCYLSEASRRTNNNFPLAALHDLFTNIFTSQHVGSSIVVCWHSGEPLLLKPAYYDEAIHIIREVAREHRNHEFTIRFDMQTNGTLIDDKWCEFFLRHRDAFDIGISVDGPARLHDAHRVTWTGKSTHDRVVRGMDALARAGLVFNIIAVVPPSAVESADELFDFVETYREHLTDFHFNFMDAPVMSLHDLTCDDPQRERYHRFLTRLLRRFADHAGGRPALRIRNFAHMYQKMFGEPGLRQELSARSMSRPFRTLNVEVDGSVTTFYAGLTSREYSHIYGDGAGLVIGNLLRQPLDEIAASPKMARIWDDFEQSHKACEAGCDYFELCSGGFNLTKRMRFGTFDATETPECRIHTKTLADAVIDDLRSHVRDRLALSIGEAPVPRPE